MTDSAETEAAYDRISDLATERTRLAVEVGLLDLDVLELHRCSSYDGRIGVATKNAHTARPSLVPWTNGLLVANAGSGTVLLSAG